MLDKAILWAAALGLVLAIVVFGVRQYGNARVAAQELSTVQEAVSEAVQARDASLVRDIRQVQDRAAAVDSVRSSTSSLKEKSKDATKAQKGESHCVDAVGDAAGDAERTRLLNVAIAQANRAISSTE